MKLVEDGLGLPALEDAGGEGAKDRSADTGGLGPADDVRDEVERLDTELAGPRCFRGREALRERLTDEDLGRSVCAIDAKRSP